jgi:hypothetical protein
MASNQRPINYYDILGVPPNASTEEIDVAYRARIAAYHPDGNPSTDAPALVAAALINEAGQVLGDRERRRVYDSARAISEGGTIGGTPAFESMCERAGSLLARVLLGAGMAPESVVALGQRLQVLGDYVEGPSGHTSPTVWLCPHCGRHVPNRIGECRCGFKRTDSETAPPISDTGRSAQTVRRGMQMLDQLDTRKTLLILVTILTLSVAYYFVIALPAGNNAKFEFDRDKYNKEQAIKVGSRIAYDDCLKDADTAYFSYLKLNGSVNDDGTIRADDRFFVRAAADKKDAVDACYKRYGGGHAP